MPSKMAQNLKPADLFALVWRVWKTLGQKQKVGHHGRMGGGNDANGTWTPAEARWFPHDAVA